VLAAFPSYNILLYAEIIRLPSPARRDYQRIKTRVQRLSRPRPWYRWGHLSANVLAVPTVAV